MNWKRIIAVSVLRTVLVASVVWPFGSAEDGEYVAATGEESWTHDFQVQDLEEGTYNLIVRATDHAGNVSYGGPINVEVDPESDRPLVNISNPLPGMRVGNNLNILGTSVDDDSVSRVEVSLDDGPFQRAEGTEYWSYYLDVSPLTDGIHTATVRAVDQGGVESHPFHVSFDLDQLTPALAINSHEDGTLLHKRVSVTGTAEDLNGVVAVALSRDGRESWEELKIDTDKTARTAGFRFDIDTEEMEDGPHVYWLEARDRTGSSGQLAFLFFVDNRPPELEILWPPEEYIAVGDLTLVGTIKDQVGVARFSYQLAGGEEQEIPLTAGNPYWVQHVDLTEAKSSSLTFTVEDRTGNSTKLSRKISVDAEANRPVVTIFSPADGAFVSDSVVLTGSVRDDDDVAGIEISVDGGDFVRTETAEAFAVALDAFEAGVHRIAVRGVDTGGVAGSEVRLEVVTESLPPRVDLLEVVIGDETLTFTPGLIVPAEIAARLRGRAESDVPLEATIGQAAPKRVASGDFELSLGKDLPNGRVDIEISLAGQDELVMTSFLYKGEVSDPPGIVLSDVRLGADGVINLTEDSPLLAFVSGPPISSATTVPASDQVSLSHRNNVVTVRPRSGRGGEPFRIEVETSGGGSFQTRPITVLSDFEAPRLTVSEPHNGDWITDAIRVAGSVQDAGTVKSLEIAIGDGSYSPLSLDADVFDQVVPVAAGDGLVVLSLRARDTAGNQDIRRFALSKDTQGPVLEMIAPGAADPVQGTITLTGTVADAGVVEKVEISDDGESFSVVDGTQTFSIDLDLASFETPPEAFVLRATDRSGNVVTRRVPLTMDQESDRPVAEIQIPEQRAVLTTDFVVSGMAFDDDGVSEIVYRLDDGDPVTVEIENSFSIPISLSSVADNEHTITIYATDIHGVTGPEAVTAFMISTAEPVGELQSPLAEATVSGPVILEGTASDKNGVGSVYVSLDNGNTFNLADGTEVWTYPLNTDLLADGTHSIQIRTIDAVGVEALYTAQISTDNTAPDLHLESPADGDRLAGAVTLDGSVTDGLRLESVRYDLRPLGPAATDSATEGPESTDTSGTTGEGAPTDPVATVVGTPVLSGELMGPGVFLESLDLGSVTPGWYNLRLEAVDAAGNSSYVSRNFVVQSRSVEGRVEILFPGRGESLSGAIEIGGRLVGMEAVGDAVILVDGAPAGSAPLSQTGYFSLALQPGALRDGEHTLAARVGARESQEQKILYRATGPWVAFSELGAGTYVTGRPVLGGTAGYYTEDVSDEAERDRDSEREHEVLRVDVSLDNGRSFVPAKGTDDWRYRLETSLIPDGDLVIITRASFADGDQAVRRTLLIVDRTAPEVRLADPAEGGRFNDTIALSGIAHDDSGLADLAVSLREGSKGRYQIPGFVQGLYLDVHALGATVFDAGVGVSFFDDNVRLQMQMGVAPPGRFSGLVIGSKLLANIVYLPFGYWFGPGWEFFSMSFALGANFSYFTMSDETFSFTSDGLVLAAVLAQWEMARFSVEEWKTISYVSVYTEGNLWFISSDVQAGFEPRVCFGARIGFF